MGSRRARIESAQPGSSREQRVQRESAGSGDDQEQRSEPHGKVHSRLVAMLQKPYRGSGSRFRSELSEVVDPELLLDTGDAVHHLLEAVRAEELVLLVLELLAQGVVLVAADDLAEGGKENRVLPSLVRAVHPDEAFERVRQELALARIADRLESREMQRRVRQPPARAVLRQQHLDQVHQCVGLAEARKEKILLELLVVVLDERPDDSGRVRQRFGRQLFPGIQPAQRLSIDEQHALQHPVLPHQIHGGRDFLLALVGLAGRPLLLFLWLTHATRPAVRQRDAPNATLAWRKCRRLCSRSITESSHLRRSSSPIQKNLALAILERCAPRKAGFQKVSGVLEGDLERGGVTLIVPNGSEHELRPASGKDPVPGVALAPPPLRRVWLPGVNLICQSIVEVELRRKLEPRCRKRLGPDLEVHVDRPPVIPAGIDRLEPCDAASVGDLVSAEELLPDGIEARILHVRVHAEMVAMPDIHERTLERCTSVGRKPGDLERQVERCTRLDGLVGRIGPNVGPVQRFVNEVWSFRLLRPNDAAGQTPPARHRRWPPGQHQNPRRSEKTEHLPSRQDMTQALVVVCHPSDFHLSPHSPTLPLPDGDAATASGLAASCGCPRPPRIMGVRVALVANWEVGVAPIDSEASEWTGARGVIVLGYM